MNDLNTAERTKNTVGNILAIVGMLVAVAIQMAYFHFFGLINWVDGIVTGIIAGICIIIGFKLGKGVSGKTFPIFLVVIAVVSVILGFSLGITFWVHNLGGVTIGGAFLIFFDEYLFTDIQGTTLYHSQGIIDFGIAIGIAVLIVGGKYFVQQSTAKKDE